MGHVIMDPVAVGDRVRLLRNDGVVVVGVLVELDAAGAGLDRGAEVLRVPAARLVAVRAA